MQAASDLNSLSRYMIPPADTILSLHNFEFKKLENKL